MVLASPWSAFCSLAICDPEGSRAWQLKGVGFDRLRTNNLIMGHSMSDLGVGKAKWALLTMVGVTTLVMTGFIASPFTSVQPSDQLQQQEPQHPNARVPVVVVMGGFRSCNYENGLPTPKGKPRWYRAEDLEARLTQSEFGTPAATAAKWVRTCYSSSGEIFYVTSAKPGSIRRATNADLSPFFLALAALAGGGDDGHPVYIIGHSHGGWLAMMTAWGLPASVNVRSLFTVDPISPLECTWKNYVLASSSWFVPWSTNFCAVDGCQKAPSDFAVARRYQLLKRMPERGWWHYYQRNFLPLRSSSYEGGAQPYASYDVSPFLAVFAAGAHASTSAHVDIDGLNLIWEAFAEMMIYDLKTR